ncbi:MAG: phosphoribosylglycinamide formyltransferase [Lachnospiraceae bacterium]|nr:phosphoribosylglycinamide formyltransferase [Lachnospiraceae bacterium]
MLRIVVCVSGGGTNLQALIDAIGDGRITDAEIVRVISSSAGAYAMERARKAGIEAVSVVPAECGSRAEFEEKLAGEIRKADPGLIVLAGYLVVLPAALVEEYENRIINIHPSLIPSFCGKGYYGLRVHEAALERGVRVTGATVHFVDSGTDTGPIILQKAVEIQEGDTPEVLQKRVMQEAEHRILPEAVQLIARGRVRTEGRKVIIE